MSKNKRPRSSPPAQPQPAALAPIGVGQQAVRLAAQQSTDHHALIRRDIVPLIECLEQVCGHKILTYFLDDVAAIADEQIYHIYEHLRRIGKQEKIGLFISSRGGATEVPWKIVSLFREYAKSFVVLIPYRAHSAATHVALGADEIVMTEMSELGPVDPSRSHPLLPTEQNQLGKRIPVPVSVQDLRHVLDFLKREMGEGLSADAAAHVYTALFDKVHPLAIGALEQTWDLARQISERVLSTHMDPVQDAQKIRDIVDKLSGQYKSHLYQINRREAVEIGLKVRNASDEEVEKMWDLYLAYQKIAITGEATVGAESMNVSRLGHIDSTAGTTVGFAISNKTDGSVMGARWESKWLDQQAAQQPARGGPQLPAGAGAP